MPTPSVGMRLASPDEVVIAIGTTTPRWQQVDVEVKDGVKGPLSSFAMIPVGATGHVDATIRNADAPEGPYAAVLLRWDGEDPTKSDDIYREALLRGRAYLAVLAVLIGEQAVMPFAVRLLELTPDGPKEQGWSPAFLVEANVDHTNLTGANWENIRSSLKSLEDHKRRDSIVLACGWHDRARTIPDHADAFLAEFLAIQALITSHRALKPGSADSERAMFRAYSADVLGDVDETLFPIFSRLWDQRHRLFKFGLRNRISRQDYDDLSRIVVRALRAELSLSGQPAHRDSVHQNATRGGGRSWR